ncbi:MAG TPA: shikimate kinase [Chthonomonadaceae bacterium]|nr:shikimate kinase [Chthonomonadaceae bacterium]
MAANGRPEWGAAANLALIGFMGAGKSTIGRLCAARLGYAFRDADAVIVARAGMSIPEVFMAEGEAGFRAREREVIAELAAGRRQVIATGGGSVLDRTNRARLRASCAIAGLRARPETILDRVGDPAARPLLAAAADPASRVTELLARRAPVYASCADRTFDTDALTADEVAEQVVAWYGSVSATDAARGRRGAPRRSGLRE